ncbi:MAG: hypothetical protein M1831_000057 [Alyxoria varia]|nr:MAG: hypothetical protein M1831_000057 [Alyxoria varia]
MSQTAQETVALLEQRLERVEFHLRQSGEWSQPSRDGGDRMDNNETVAKRLSRLEKRLVDYPEAFDPYPSNSGNSLPNQSEHLHVLSAYEPFFASAASELTSLENRQVPQGDALVPLIALQPRLQNALAVQETQAAEVEELKRRSATVLAQWYQNSVIEDGEQWAEWERRLVKVEQQVRRAEAAKYREERASAGRAKKVTFTDPDRSDW